MKSAKESDQRILQYLCERGIAQQKDLADTFSLEASSIFRKMQKMVKNGLVTQRKMGQYRYYEPSPRGYRYYESDIKNERR